MEEALFPLRGWADTCHDQGLTPAPKGPPHGWSPVAADSWPSGSPLSPLACGALTQTIVFSQVPLLLGFASSQVGMSMRSHAKPPQWSAASLELALTQEQLQC